MRPICQAVGGALLLLACTIFSPFSGAQTARDNPLLYEILDRLQQLEQELRQLRGDFEFFQYQQGGDNIPSDNANNEQRYLELERRLTRLEQLLARDQALSLNESNEPSGESSTPSPVEPSSPLAGVAIAATSPASRPSAEPTPVAPAEQTEYNLALSRLRAGRYPQAASDFQAFINAYPASPLLSDAYFWLAEAYYANRDFERAKQLFLLLGSRYPDSDKLPDALLKLGYTYSELGDNGKARQVLERLRAAFPDTPAANLAEKHLPLLR